MFDHSVAVIDAISRSIKKYLNIVSIITELLFIAYYAYLIIINVDSLPFLIAYSLIELFAFCILLVTIVGYFSDLDRQKKRHKAKTKRLIQYCSWVVKLAVIVYNIVLIVQDEVSEAGKIFLIFSAVFLLIQILLTMVSSLTSFYLDLLLYGLKVDYENLTNYENTTKRPIGKMLTNATKDLDYQDILNEYSIKHEVRGAIKKEIESEFPLKINNRIIKRRKAERIILHYYSRANKYYISNKRLASLIEDLNNNHITYLTSDDHLYVLLFFVNNHLEKNYKGLSEYAIKLIIATLLFIEDGNDRSMVDLTYKAITKELFNEASWSEPLKDGIDRKEYQRVLEIIHNTKEENKKNRDETIMQEFKDITINQVDKTLDLNTTTGKIIHHFINKKRNK